MCNLHTTHQQLPERYIFSIRVSQHYRAMSSAYPYNMSVITHTWVSQARASSAMPCEEYKQRKGTRVERAARDRQVNKETEAPSSSRLGIELPWMWREIVMDDAQLIVEAQIHSHIAKMNKAKIPCCPKSHDNSCFLYAAVTTGTPSSVRMPVLYLYCNARPVLC